MKSAPAILSIAMAAFFSAGASAQQPPARTDQPVVPGMTKSDDAAKDATKPAAGVPTPPRASGEVSIIAQQRSGETLASDMKGLNVKNNADEQLGTVSDLVLSDDGKLNAVLIRVGGFLGIGSSDVAVARESIKLTTDKNGNTVAKVETTREALEKAPRYVTVKGQIESQRASQPPAPRSSPGTGAPPSGRVN